MAGSICQHSTMTAAIDLDSALDEQHAAVLSMLPPDLMDLSDIPTARARLDGLLAMMPAPELPADVTITEVMAPSVDGAPDVRLKVYTPSGLEAGAGALLWIHGGGMVLLNADGDDFVSATRASEHGCVVVSVDYRLAPETPAPGPVDDCFAALTWLGQHADELGVSADRIMIGGASAGAGLAAGTALRARDVGWPDARRPAPRVPDARPSQRDAEQPRDPGPARVEPVGERRRVGGLPRWCRADRRTRRRRLADDLSALPPAYISVGTFDMFHDEDVAYATALNRAGVVVRTPRLPGRVPCVERVPSRPPDVVAVEGRRGRLHLPLSRRSTLNPMSH